MQTPTWQAARSNQITNWGGITTNVPSRRSLGSAQVTAPLGRDSSTYLFPAYGPAENGSKNVSGWRYYRTRERLVVRVWRWREADTVTDPGWDIPGVPRDAAAGPAAGSAASGAGAAGADGSAAGRPSRRRSGRAGSVSALAGSSAGAFSRSSDDAGQSEAAPLAAGAAPPAGTPLPAGPSFAEGAGGGTAAPGRVVPADAAQALSYLSGALEFLARADAAEWPAGVQADCLRALAVAESRQAAAHARILAAFAVPGGGLNSDGHRSARVWLTWQTAATRKAAGAKVASMHALA